jgi:hypothetical protein
VGFMACFALVAGVGYFIYTEYTSRLEPPRLNNYVPIPVQMGDKTVLIGVGVVQWDVPPELNAVMLKMAKAELDDAKKRDEAAGKSLSDAKTAAGGKPALPPEKDSKP